MHVPNLRPKIVNGRRSKLLRPFYFLEASLLDHDNLGAFRHAVVEILHVLVAHPETTRR